MNFNTPVVELDLTGSNPDNLFENELHTLTANANRAIAPKKGPFFSESLLVFNEGVRLGRGSDYQVVELHQDASLRTAKEIHSVILVINPNVGQNISISYQALGGHYGKSDDAIANLFESVLNDNRPVVWSNILNKPNAFEPVNHRHYLEDVYGWEYVVDYLDRIRKAITLGQVSIVLEVVDLLLSRFKVTELPFVLPSRKAVHYDALLYFLSKRKLLSNLSIDTYEDIWLRGNVVKFYIDTTDYPPNQELVWEIYLEDNREVSFISNNKGTITSNGGIVDVSFYLPLDETHVDTIFYIGVKEKFVDPEFLAVTYSIRVATPPVASTDYGILLMSRNYSNHFYLNIARYVANNELRTWYSTQDLTTNIKGVN